MVLYFLLSFFLSHSSESNGFEAYNSEIEIPEPLFIDLVRGLNSTPGEWEVNTLFTHSQGFYDDMEWAPEIEWVVSPGQALEFEIPMKGDSVQFYKWAFQSRLSPNEGQRTLYGVQGIYEVDSEWTSSRGTFFSLLAHRWSHEFSTVALVGAKANFNDSSQNAFLWNQTLFYNYSREVDFGAEINGVFGSSESRFFQLVPQVHLALKRGYKLQFGWGAREENGLWGPVGVLRLILEFNKPDHF